MMTDDRDPLLETLFAEAESELDGELFTAQAIAQPLKLKHRLLAVGVCVVLIVGLCAWLFAVPVQEFALLLTQFLSTPLFELGESSLTGILSPVNNLASGLVLTAKLLWVGWKKITGVTYAY